MRFSPSIAPAIATFLALLIGSAPPQAFCERPTSHHQIRIGALFSLSSWGAEGGQSELHGARLAVDEINRDGGVGGVPLELVVEDNGSDLAKTASSFQKLVAVDRVSVVIGPNWVEFFQIAAPLAKRMRVPIVSASGGGTTAGRGWAFTLWPPPTLAVTPLADDIAERGIKRVAILLSENAYYQGIADALISELKKRGISIVMTERFNPGHTDFRSTLASQRGRAVEGIVALLLETGDLASFLKQRTALKINTPVFGANTIPFDPILQSNLTIAEGLTFFDYVGENTPAFDQEYITRFKHPPGFGSAKAYDAVHLVRHAMIRCGHEPTAVARCLGDGSYHGVTGDLSFDENGIIESRRENTTLFEVRGGKIIPYPVIQPQLNAG